MGRTVTRVRDPVCGMEFGVEEAAARTAYRGRTYHFCAESCWRHFESDPPRYAERDAGEPAGRSIQDLGFVRHARRPIRDAQGDVNVCPLCGTDTRIRREAASEIWPMSLAELETIARHEWRRRLGSSSYERDHSCVLIRALVVFALGRESPVRAAVAQQLIWWELTNLGRWGMGRADIQREFRELAQAVGDVLVNAGVERRLARSLADAIGQMLGDTLGWPDLRSRRETAT